MKKIILILFVLISLSIYSNEKKEKVKLGIDIFLEEAYKEYKGKKIGLITNQTGFTSKLTVNIDEMATNKDINLIKLFCPEHGIRGVSRASEKIDDERDAKTDLPILSLYGKYRKPSPEMVEDIDVLIYDIQDIGVRTYTYIYTMAYAMQTAAENNKEFVVLDRPIPMYGNLVEGNILESEFSSFIGLYPIPYIYGMTSGETAMYFNKEFNINANLKVVKMENYNHEMDYVDTGLHWVPTSPHIPTEDTAYYYASTGSIGELGTISNGVGYTMPFKLIGQEWIDGEKLTEELNALKLPGVYFRPVSFKPFYTSLKDKICSGVHIMITDNKKYKPFLTQLYILEKLYSQGSESGFLDKNVRKDRIDMFDKSMGTDKIRKSILAGQSVESIVKSYQKELDEYMERRKKYLLY